MGFKKKKKKTQIRAYDRGFETVLPLTLENGRVTRFIPETKRAVSKVTEAFRVASGWTGGEPGPHSPRCGSTSAGQKGTSPGTQAASILCLHLFTILRSQQMPGPHVATGTE